MFTKSSPKSDQRAQTSASEVKDLEDKVNLLKSHKNSLEEQVKLEIVDLAFILIVDCRPKRSKTCRFYKKKFKN